jgi:hypothetical protein
VPRLRAVPYRNALADPPVEELFKLTQQISAGAPPA